MPAYLTTDDCKAHLRDAFARLYVLPADQADLDKAIALVEALVNGSVGKRYIVPVTTPQEAVLICQALALDLFAEHAYKTRGSGAALPEKLAKAADTARKQLVDIATGKFSLAGAAAPENPDAGGSALLISGNEPQFTRRDLEGF